MIGDDQAVAKGDDAVHIGGDLSVVRDHYDRQSALAVKAGDDFHDLDRNGRVQVSGGLVGEQDGGFVDQGARDGHALLLAARQLIGVIALAAGQPHHRKQGLGALRPVGGPSGVKQRQLHIFQRRGAGEQVEALEDEPDSAAADCGQLLIIERSDVHALQQIAARGGPVQAAQNVHQRGFAGSRSPHNGHELAALDIETGGAQCPDLNLSKLVGLAQVAYFNDLFHYLTPARN